MSRLVISIIASRTNIPVVVATTFIGKNAKNTTNVIVMSDSLFMA